jgi:hypothetical protein
MTTKSEESNKALVLEAFDTLFNKRDYAAAERFWSSNYIQHSAHIEPGREGLFNGDRQIKEHEAEQDGELTSLSVGKKFFGAWVMKYATAMSPARTNATGRVKRPIRIRRPPTSSRAPWTPISENSVGAA